MTSNITTSNEALCTFSPDSTEYHILQVAASLMTKLAKEQGCDHLLFKVDNVYFDIDQAWIYTTIVAHNTNAIPRSVLGSWQALTPKLQFDILTTGDDVTALTTLLLPTVKNDISMLV